MLTNIKNQNYEKARSQIGRNNDQSVLEWNKDLTE
jgi:hypothetical protein